jgi:hypothetical protein
LRQAYDYWQNQPGIYPKDGPCRAPPAESLHASETPPCEQSTRHATAFRSSREQEFSTLIRFRRAFSPPSAIQRGGGRPRLRAASRRRSISAPPSLCPHHGSRSTFRRNRVVVARLGPAEASLPTEEPARRHVTPCTTAPRFVRRPDPKDVGFDLVIDYSSTVHKRGLPREVIGVSQPLSHRSGEPNRPSVRSTLGDVPARSPCSNSASRPGKVKCFDRSLFLSAVFALKSGGAELAARVCAPFFFLLVNAKHQNEYSYEHPPS